MILNKIDINDRLLNNPEPIEVSKMRQYILDSFSNLEFIEAGHTYYLHNSDGSKVKVPSVSSLIADLEPKADWDKIKENYARKNNMTVQQVSRMWEENNLRSTNNGTSTHLYGENLMKFVMGSEDFDAIIQPQYEKGYLIPYSPKQEAVQKYWQDMFRIPSIYPLLPEVKMYMPLDNRFGIKKLYCGTADITLAYQDPNSGEWCTGIMDFKTNGSLTNDFARSRKTMMLPPFNDLIDEPLSHYTIQLGLYSLMLMNLGFKVIDRRLIWLKEDGTYDKIALPDITQRLIQYYG
jgi:hypothetical protein